MECFLYIQTSKCKAKSMKVDGGQEDYEGMKKVCLEIGIVTDIYMRNVIMKPSIS